MEQMKRKGIRWFDWAVFIALAIGCHLIFMHSDIRHTAGASFAYLNGHILDFYSYTDQTIGGCVYMPTTYILFAVWNLPLKLLGICSEVTMNHPYGVQLWYSMLPILFYVGIAYLMWKIARELGYGEKQARVAAYGFAASPIAFYSQFMFCQYDSITLFFVMLGVYYYFRDDMFRFVLFFAVAITCKYYALMVFVPMVLLREKNVWKIMGQVAGSAGLLAVEFLLYLGDRSMSSNITGFQATNYIFQAGIGIGASNAWISAVILVWAVVSAYSFFLNPKDRTERWKWFLYLESFVMFCIYGLSVWHPQWVLFAIPFMVFGTVTQKRSDVFWLLDLVMMFCFVWFLAHLFPGNADQELLNGGLLRETIAGRARVTLMRDLPILSNTSLQIPYSVFSAVLLINALFKHPKYMISDLSEETHPQAGLLRLRFLAGIAIFLVPCMICLRSMLKAPYPDADRISQAEDMIYLQEEGGTHELEQYFIPEWDQLEWIDIAFGYLGNEEGELTLRVEDETTGNTLLEAVIPRAEVIRQGRNRLRFDPISMEQDHVYKAVLSGGMVEDGLLTLYTVPKQPGDGVTLLDGEEQDYSASFVFYGR